MRALLLGGFVGLLGLISSGGVFAQGSPVAATAPGSEAEILELRQRVAGFWAARVAGDADAQWQLLEPRGKGLITVQEYGAAPTGGKYLAYQVEDASIKGFFATVKVKVLVQQLLSSPGAARSIGGPQVTTVEDGWIKIGGVWYRRFEDVAKLPTEPRQP